MMEERRLEDCKLKMKIEERRSKHKRRMKEHIIVFNRKKKVKKNDEKNVTYCSSLKKKNVKK